MIRMDLLENVLVEQALPVHPATGLQALGVLASGRVVWPALGRAGEDDDKADEEQEDQEDESADHKDSDGENDGKGDADDEGDDKDTGKDKDGGAKEDVVSRAEFRKVIKERQAAKAALRARDQEVADLKRANEDDAEKATREAAEAASAAAEAKYKPITVKAALLEAGVKAGRVKGALKLVDMGEIEVDADGEVTGITDQIDLLKEDWPELFAEPESDKQKGERRRGSSSRAADGADKKPEKPKPKTASERQAEALLGK